MTHTPPLTQAERDKLKDLGLDPRAFGETLRLMRAARQEDITEAAARVNVNRMTIRNWENGQFSPLALRLMAYALEGTDGTQAAFWRERALAAERVVTDLRTSLGTYDKIRRDGHEL